MACAPWAPRRELLWRGLLLAAAAAVFFAGLGRLPLFGRDEALYAEAAREMLASGDWITPRVNGEPFFEKPPLYYWLTAASYRMLGVSPLAARLPAALASLLTIALTVSLGARVWGLRAGVLAGLALASCLHMAIIGRLGILDAPLTLLITIALLLYARWWQRGTVGLAAAFGAVCGLAFLMKGLAAGLAPAAAALHFSITRPPRRRLSAAHALLGLAAAALVAAPWVAAMALRHGQAYGAVFLMREHFVRVAQPMQGHGGPVWYYLALLLVSFFPWVLFAPAAGLSLRRADSQEARLWHGFALIWIAVVLVPFSLVRTKLPGYVTPLLPPLALLVGAELDRRLREPGRAPWIAVMCAAALLAPLVALLPLLGERLGERVGAAGEAARLVLPTALWVGGWAAAGLGGALALTRRISAAIAFLASGQALAIGAALAGFLPVLSPYLGGGPARLAELAARELPGHSIVLYDTRPETVAFVLRRIVPTYGRAEWDLLLDRLEQGPTALIAPLPAQDRWATLPARRVWREGDRVLLQIPSQRER